MVLPRILIVEDEAVLRASMVRGLARLPADVHDAMTVTDAVDAIDRLRPDLVVSDIDLPDRSGIELIGELGKRGLTTPIIFVSAYLRAYRAQIPPHANVEVLEKPVALADLRTLIQGRLGKIGAPAEDAPAPFAAADYVQLSCLGHHSVTIEVVGAGGHSGVIVIHQGDVWHAEDERGLGVDAFRRLAFATEADIRCRTLRTAPGPRSIEARWEALLMDSARVHDEEAHARARGRAPAAGLDPGDLADLDRVFDAVAHDGDPFAAVGLDDDVDLDPDVEIVELEELDAPAPRTAQGTTPPAPPPDPGPDLFALAWDRALAAMLARDYPAAVDAFVEARRLRPDDARVAGNLERLAALGHHPRGGDAKDDHGQTDRSR